MAWNAPLIGSVTTVASGNLTLTEPSGAAQNDLLIACIAMKDLAGFTLPSGWAAISEPYTSAAAAQIAGYVFAYLVRGASAPSYAFTRSLGDVATGRVLAYRCTAGVPTYETGTYAMVTGPTTIAGGVTVTRSGSLLVAMHASADPVNVFAFDAASLATVASGATDTSTGPTSNTWIERADTTTTTGSDTALAIADAIANGTGSTGDISVSNTIDEFLGHCLAVGVFYERARPRAFGVIIG
jgi:hypothetical protein